MRWLSASLLLALLGATGAAAAPALPDGARELGGAAVYLSVKPQAGYEVLAEVRKLLSRRMQAGLPLLGMGLTRELGFDPLSSTWLEAAGLDPSAPVFAAFFSQEPVAARARLARVEKAARAHLSGASRGSRFEMAEVGGPLAWLRHRLVFKVRAEDRARSFMAGVATNLGSRAVLLQGKSKAELTGPLAALLGLEQPAAEALGGSLLGKNVVLVGRPDRNLIVLYRLQRGQIIVDLGSELVGIPEKPGDHLASGLLAALGPAAREVEKLAASGVARRIFHGSVQLGLLIRARPFLEVAAEQDGRDLLRRAMFGATPESFGKRLQELRACRKSFGSASALLGDLGLQLGGDKQGLHARVLWAAPVGVARAFQRAVASRDLIDPTEWQGKVVALAGLGVELGPLLRTLPQPAAFKLDPRVLMRQASTCSGLSASTMLLGGWVGLLGLARSELKDQEQASMLLEHAGSAMLLLRDLSTPSRPSWLAQVRVPASAAAKTRASLAKLAHQLGQPDRKTIAGRGVTIYPHLKAPLYGYSMAVSEENAEGITVTVSSSRWELPSFLQQKSPQSRILPASILAYAHAQLPRLLTALSLDPNLRPIGKMLRDASQRVDQLGANVTLSEGILVGEIRIGLR